MADGIDAKGIGLAVKDIVVGVAAAAVGAGGGGQAGAAGVLKAGDGIDKIISLATDSESRGQKFDRAGFESRPRPAVVAPPAKTVQSPPTETTQSPPALTDRDQALAHLGNVGWSREQIEKILAGPSRQPLAQIAPPQVEGQRVALVDANPIDLVQGSPVAPVPASALMAQGGKSIQSVRGRLVNKNETT
jgi:hypothetical protein